MATDNNKMIILFDGVCNMCVWSIQFIISKDIPLSSPLGNEGNVMISRGIDNYFS